MCAPWSEVANGWDFARNEPRLGQVPAGIGSKVGPHALRDSQCSLAGGLVPQPLPPNSAGGAIVIRQRRR
jgi:hypothetical protein